MRRTLLTLMTAAAFLTAHAQVPNMEPPVAINELKWMSGTWEGKGSFSAQGMEMDYTVSMTCSIDGQFLKTYSVNDFGVMKMSETMYIGWEEAKKEYVGYAFTNMAPTPRIERGKLEGASWILVSEPWEVMGTSMVTRATMTKVSDTKSKFKLEMKNGDKWDVASEVELTKK